MKSSLKPTQDLRHRWRCSDDIALQLQIPR